MSGKSLYHTNDDDDDDFFSYFSSFFIIYYNENLRKKTAHEERFKWNNEYKTNYDDEKNRMFDIQSIKQTNGQNLMKNNSEIKTEKISNLTFSSLNIFSRFLFFFFADHV